MPRPASRRLDVRSRRRGIHTAFAAVALSTAAMGLSACESDTVSLRYEPEVGDRYRSRAVFETAIESDLDGSTDRSSDTIVVDAVEEVIAVESDEVVIEAIVRRDGAANRTYETRFDRGARPRAIDLVQGVSVDALGIDVSSAAANSVIDIPAGDRRVGDTWKIDEVVIVGSIEVPVRVTGTVTLAGLEATADEELARVESVIVVPLTTAIDTPNGRVTVVGDLEIRSVTRHDLDGGVIRSERSELRGRFDVLVEAPPGLDTSPVPGVIDYDLTVDLQRVDLP